MMDSKAKFEKWYKYQWPLTYENWKAGKLQESHDVDIVCNEDIEAMRDAYCSALSHAQEQSEPIAVVEHWNVGGSGFHITANGIDKLPHGAKLYASPQPAQEWLPISEAPNDVVVIVLWFDKSDFEHPERYDFDCKENGVWQQHEEHFDSFRTIALPPESIGPSAIAPYTHWMPLPAAPKQDK